MTPSGETLRLLDFIMNVKKNTRCLNRGGIETHNDNKRILNDIGQAKMKESQYTQEAGSIIERIRRKLNDTNVKPNFALAVFRALCMFDTR